MALEMEEPSPLGSNRRKLPTYGEASVRTADCVRKLRSGSVLRANVSATAVKVLRCSVASWKLPSVVPETRTMRAATPMRATRTLICRFGDPSASPKRISCFHRGLSSSGNPPNKAKTLHHLRWIASPLREKALLSGTSTAGLLDPWRLDVRQAPAVPGGGLDLVCVGAGRLREGADLHPPVARSVPGDPPDRPPKQGERAVGIPPPVVDISRAELRE